MIEKIVVVGMSAVLAVSTLSGCASAPDKIAASYVSPVQYAGLDCTQIESEMARVSSQVQTVSGAQQRKHTNDEVAMGVGLVLFWPALFFLATSDQKEQLAQLKGDYDALQAVALQHHCGETEQVQPTAIAEHRSPTTPQSTSPIPVALTTPGARAAVDQTSRPTPSSITPTPAVLITPAPKAAAVTQEATPRRCGLTVATDPSQSVCRSN
jgi:hypothetical protein